MSFTIDGWTSIAGRSYYGVTIHYIDNEWKYRSVVLDFIPSRGRHTGEDIATIFHACLLEYDIIDKIQGITVDNATSNTKFMHELDKQLPHFDLDNQHFRCFAHILNLGVQDLLKTLARHSETDNKGQEQQYEDNEDETEEDEEYAPNIADSLTAITKLRSICSKIKRSEILKRKFSLLVKQLACHQI
ncbi:unnamed protein product [Parnassius mnemosyne]|uniref:Transposase n=1 Tax=Parnassius mnemosyne TaxID=213953 RepID=A0AAV1LEL9_9NEOP